MPIRLGARPSWTTVSGTRESLSLKCLGDEHGILRRSLDEKIHVFRVTRQATISDSASPTSRCLFFLEFNNATNSFKSSLGFIRLRKRDQFAENIQPRLRRQRLVIFKIRIVGFGKGAENANHFFNSAIFSGCASGIHLKVVP